MILKNVKKKIAAMRALADNCGKRLDERMKKRHKKCKEYRKNEQVLVRISNKKGKKTQTVGF